MRIANRKNGARYGPKRAQLATQVALPACGEFQIVRLRFLYESRGTCRPLENACTHAPTFFTCSRALETARKEWVTARPAATVLPSPPSRVLRASASSESPLCGTVGHPLTVASSKRSANMP